jgi:glycosyltransferase involved in cell wall biosynthesis
MIWKSVKKANLMLMTEEIKAFVKHLDSNVDENLRSKNASYPKISIITPSYNQAAFLERTILSVLNQNYPNLEYIIIDGGSSDGSVNIIKKYKKYLSFWSSEPDKGQSHAINKGFKKATGEWIGFQNSDDIFLPGAIKALAEAIIANKDAEIVYGHLLRIDENDNIKDIQIHVSSPLWMQLAQMHIQNQGAIWRRSLLDKYGYLDENMHFCFDNEYFARLLRGGVKYKIVDRYIGAFRSQPEAKSSTIKEASEKDTREVLKRYGNFLYFNKYMKKIIQIISKIHKFFWCAFHGKIWYLMRNSR